MSIAEATPPLTLEEKFTDLENLSVTIYNQNLIHAAQIAALVEVLVSEKLITVEVWHKNFELSLKELDRLYNEKMKGVQESIEQG